MVDKIKNLIKRIETQKGDITLFMLWKDSPEIDKWTVVISSSWIDRMNQRTALDYWIRSLQNNLNTQELNSISRVSFLKTNDQFVQFLTHALNVSGGAVRFSQNQIGNYYINDAIIFEAKKTSYSRIPMSSASRNPAINGTINPNINGTINPNINGTINPNINGTINPNINGTLNPNINGTINPNINGTINPNINGTINPNINGTINPNINGAINPLINPNFVGLVLYDMSLSKTAYFVKAQNNILLMFDFSNNFIGFCVKVGVDFYNVFDTGNNWIGYLVLNGQNGFNYFSTNANWVGFVI